MAKLLACGASGSVFEPESPVTIPCQRLDISRSKVANIEATYILITFIPESKRNDMECSGINSSIIFRTLAIDSDSYSGLTHRTIKIDRFVLLLSSRDIAEISLKRRKFSIQPTNLKNFII